MFDEHSPDSPSEHGEISPVTIEGEMRRSYLDYAMSVIVSRALPDVRDGLKPVHRRILYSMHENSYDWNKPYRKSARVVGDVIGQYHPHGDQSIYDALVRMAQPFSMGAVLIDGQGNFGSVDGDSAAAMRYTEVRMTKLAHALLEDLDKDTVSFVPNYDNSQVEPSVLPARFPNLLVNGAGGIAVGMATNIPPHNLGEVIEVCLAVARSPDLSIDEMMTLIPGPDFPTGGIILGRSGIKNAFRTGKGSIVMRGRVTIEEGRKDRSALVITEIPYQVNKALMIERIAELVRDKKIEGISDIRDESDRHGMRVVIDLKRDAIADVVLNQLYRYSPLQSTFAVNAVALVSGRPDVLTLKDFVTSFLDFRQEVVARRTRFLLKKARDRAHILVGLALAVANIDEIIRLIRGAPNPASAREQLMARLWPLGDMEPLVHLIDDPRHQVEAGGMCRLSEEQARAILELRLHRLTALGRDEISDEMHALGKEISEYLDILGSQERILSIVTAELEAIKAEFARPRKTEIIDQEGEVEEEDLIAKEDMVVTVSHAGYIKRVPLVTYRAQRRGGKGRSAMQTRDEDFVSGLFVANTHTPILCFSSRGMCYKTKVWRLPLAAPQARGKALINLFPLREGETVTSILPLPEDEATWKDLDVVFATARGTVRRNRLSDFCEVNKAGKIAMKLEENDSIVGVMTASGDQDIFLTTRLGQCIRFPLSDVRVFVGRNSVGVRGIQLLRDDLVISMALLTHFDAEGAERVAYLKKRKMMGSGEELEENEAIQSEEESTEENISGDEWLAPERYEAMSRAEQIILTVSENGYGKRTSSFEYRITGRGGKGIVAMAVTERNGPLVAALPVQEADQVMLVTDGGQVIRCPVGGIRCAGRTTQGVIIFNTAEGERVVSVERLSDFGEEE